MAKNAPSAAARAAQHAAPANLFRNAAIPFVGLALALAGIVLSFILTGTFYRHTVLDQASGCAINTYVDCDRVSASPFAAVGPVPISAFGLGMHVAVAAALAVAHFSRARVREGLIGGAALLAVAATAGSVVLAVISLFVIRALCVYCTALQVVNLALAGTLVFGLAGGVGRLRQAVRSAAPALGAGGLAVVVGAGAAAAATYGLATGVERELLASQSLYASYLSVQRYEFDAAASPRLGDPDAPVTLVVFADYNCPHCRDFDPRIIEIARTDDDVQLVYKFYPLDGTCNRSMPQDRRTTSCAAAAAAYLAHREGKFWDYSHTLYANFQRYGPNRLVDYARAVGLSEPELARTALDDRAIRARIDADIAEGNRAGLRATPTLYVNGQKFLPNMVPLGRDQFSVIRSLVDQARDR